jgi:hypothetical protein
MTGMVVVLSWPARRTIHHWGRRQLAVNPEGSIMHGVGEVVVTIV